jgi:hypothetical protein
METSLHKKLLGLKQQLLNLIICFVIRREGMILDADKLCFRKTLLAGQPSNSSIEKVQVHADLDAVNLQHSMLDFS